MSFAVIALTVAMAVGFATSSEPASQEAPSGMVLIPGGTFQMGKGPKEDALAQRMVDHAITDAREMLRTDLRGQAIVGAENFVTAAEGLKKNLETGIAQANKDLIAAMKLLQEFPDDGYLISRVATLEAFIAREEASIARVDAALAKIAFARSMEKWFVDEAPQVEVTVRPFYLDAREVTVAEYRKFCEATGRQMPWPYRAAKDSAAGKAVKLKSHPQSLFPEAVHPSFAEDNSPIAGVNFEDAKAYAEWADKRLPTEIEWEWAARGGLENPLFPWGDEDWDGSQANLGSVGYIELNPDGPNNVRVDSVRIDDGYPVLAPVGSYPANGYGLYDMAGNVLEWCEADPCYDPKLLDRLAGNTTSPLDPNEKRRWGQKAANFQPLRSSAFNYSPFEARITRRYGPPLNHTHAERGFRCAWSEE